MPPLNSIFCFSFINWVSFTRFGPQLNRVSVRLSHPKIGSALKTLGYTHPDDPKFMRALPPQDSNLHTNFQAEGETKLHKPSRF